MDSAATHSPPQRSDAEGASARLADGTALELLVGMTHDLRSPLSSILMLVERLHSGASGPLTSLQRRQLGLVYNAAFGLAALTDDVFAVASTRSRLVSEAPSPFLISDVFEAVRDLVQPIAEEKALRLRFSRPNEGKRVGHAAAMQRVLLNLVTNALKFTPTGAVTVSATPRDDGRIHCVVQDTGNGIPASLCRRRGDHVPNDGTAPFSSSGLGLAVCTQLVQAMGGFLEITSTTSGTTCEFALDLPLLP